MRKKLQDHCDCESCDCVPNRLTDQQGATIGCIILEKPPEVYERGGNWYCRMPSGEEFQVNQHKPPQHTQAYGGSGAPESAILVEQIAKDIANVIRLVGNGEVAASVATYEICLLLLKSNKFRDLAVNLQRAVLGE